MSERRVPRVHRYGDGEFMLAHGPNSGPQLIVLQPLFEEMNRCRATIAAVCRALGERGIGCWLPDLPGTGESLRDIASTSWQDWVSATVAASETVREATGRLPSTIAFRGGALLDRTTGVPGWRLAPTSGRSLLSDLRRSALASGGDPAHPAGYPLSATLAEMLSTADAEPAPDVRTLRLASDDRPADHHIEGTPFWRRPEPTFDAVMTELLVNDIADWARA
jgi:hypothetical protein